MVVSLTTEGDCTWCGRIPDSCALLNLLWLFPRQLRVAEINVVVSLTTECDCTWCGRIPDNCAWLNLVRLFPDNCGWLILMWVYPCQLWVTNLVLTVLPHDNLPIIELAVQYPISVHYDQNVLPMVTLFILTYPP